MARKEAQGRDSECSEYLPLSGHPVDYGQPVVVSKTHLAATEKRLGRRAVRLGLGFAADLRCEPQLLVACGLAQVFDNGVQVHRPAVTDHVVAIAHALCSVDGLGFCGRAQPGQGMERSKCPFAV